MADQPGSNWPTGISRSCSGDGDALDCLGPFADAPGLRAKRKGTKGCDEADVEAVKAAQNRLPPLQPAIPEPSLQEDFARVDASGPGCMVRLGEGMKPPVLITVGSFGWLKLVQADPDQGDPVQAGPRTRIRPIDFIVQTLAPSWLKTLTTDWKLPISGRDWLCFLLSSSVSNRSTSPG